MYKILLKYIPSSGKDKHMWISHGKTTTVCEGKKSTETFEEFETDDGDILKEELLKLYKIYSTSDVKVIDEIDIEHEITLIDTEEININTTSKTDATEISTGILKVMDITTSVIGKNVSDLIGNDVKVMSDGSVYGTLKNVVDFTGFSSKKSEQSGHYFPFVLSQTGTKMTIKKNGVATAAKTNMNFDPEIILRVENNDTIFTIDVDGKEVVKFNFANTILE